jgi:hypothetical protein
MSARRSRVLPFPREFAKFSCVTLKISSKQLFDQMQKRTLLLQGVGLMDS